MKILRVMGLAVLLLGLVGCASVPSAAQGGDSTASTGSAPQALASTRDPRDPWEPFNRRMDRFNQQVDQAVLKPVAQTYVQVMPQPIRTGVRNFFHNLDEIGTLVSTVLQLKPKPAIETAVRLGVNSTLGLLGVLDLATPMGLERHEEDIGQALGRWGVGTGPYLVLPLLGPSTLRDTLVRPLDTALDPVHQIRPRTDRLLTQGVRVTSQRARFLGAEDVIQGSALDPYTFVRDAYLQKRQSDVFDGDPPRTFNYDDPDAP